MGKIRKILGRAVSMKTAVILLIILVAVCIAASIVPQGRTFEQYASAYSERSAAVIIALGLDDAYHSWWFTLLSVLLCLDLAACNLVRMPATARRAAKETEPAAASSMKPDAEASGIRDPQGFLRALGMPWGKEAEDSEGKRILFSSKNRIGIWGAWICHAGIFILILGFGLGQIFTESYAVYGVAGQEKEFGSGYTLKIDDFRVLLREDDTVEQYISDITVNSPSGGSASAEISVNHPGKMFGMKFYQNSTGWAAGIRVMKGDELIQSDTVCAGEYLEIRDVPGLVVFLNAVHTLRTSRRARAAQNAALLCKQQFGRHSLGFGIMAPRAPQRAALEKHRRAYAGTVVQTEAGDIKNNAVYIAHMLTFRTACGR